MSNVNLQSPGKLLLLAIVTLGCIAVIIVNMFTGTGDTTPAWATLSAVIGYTVGNGVGAQKGEPQQPMFSPKSEKEANP